MDLSNSSGFCYPARGSSPYVLSGVPLALVTLAKGRCWNAGVHPLAYTASSPPPGLRRSCLCCHHDSLQPHGVIVLRHALWLRSHGYGDVFRKTLSLQWAVFAAFFAGTFLILGGSFLALRRAFQRRKTSTHGPGRPSPCRED